MADYTEMQWPYLRERYERVIEDFVTAKPDSIDYSEEVLRARLHGLGYRGSELAAEINLANRARAERAGEENNRRR